jgi:hypothetical protein
MFILGIILLLFDLLLLGKGILWLYLVWLLLPDLLNVHVDSLFELFSFLVEALIALLTDYIPLLHETIQLYLQLFLHINIPDLVSMQPLHLLLPNQLEQLLGVIELILLRVTVDNLLDFW